MTAPQKNVQRRKILPQGVVDSKIVPLPIVKKSLSLMMTMKASLMMGQQIQMVSTFQFKILLNF